MNINPPGKLQRQAEFNPPGKLQRQAEFNPPGKLQRQTDAGEANLCGLPYFA